MKAVILAGGKGTRLGNITKDIPKSMVEIGGKPLLEHQIELLKSQSIKEITIMVGHLSKVIQDHFGSGRKFGVSITYFEEKDQLGTTGGLKEIEDGLSDDFLVFYGDIMVNMDLRKLIEFHRCKQSSCTLVLQPTDHIYDSDLVEVDADSKVIAFHPKPHSANANYRNLANAGVYVMSKNVLRYVKRGVKADFGKDIFTDIVEKENLFGYITSEYLADIGTSDRLDKVREDFSKK